MMGGALSSGNVPIDTIEHDTERLFAAVDEPCLANKIKEIITIAEEVRETLMSIRERL